MELKHDWDLLPGSVERVEGVSGHVTATVGVLVAITDLVTVLLLVLVSGLLPTVTVIPTTAMKERMRGCDYVYPELAPARE